MYIRRRQPSLWIEFYFSKVMMMMMMMMMIIIIIIIIIICFGMRPTIFTVHVILGWLHQKGLDGA